MANRPLKNQVRQQLPEADVRQSRPDLSVGVRCGLRLLSGGRYRPTPAAGPRMTPVAAFCEHRSHVHLRCAVAYLNWHVGAAWILGMGEGPVPASLHKTKKVTPRVLPEFLPACLGFSCVLCRDDLQAPAIRRSPH